ncbi:MAG: hypothetical protein GC151_13245 [Betaproteobacteria bacterium]|nr:hypothetical protein [Betaproteobacteria bacterium]
MLAIRLLKHLRLRLDQVADWGPKIESFDRRAAERRRRDESRRKIERDKRMLKRYLVLRKSMPPKEAKECLGREFRRDDASEPLCLRTVEYAIARASAAIAAESREMSTRRPPRNLGQISPSAARVTVSGISDEAEDNATP